MTRDARSRSRVTRASGSGFYKRTYIPNPAMFYYEEVVGPFQLGREFCDDWVGGNWTDTPFFLRKGIMPAIYANGSRDQLGIFLHEAVNMPLAVGATARFREPWAYADLRPDPISPSGLAQIAASNLNPNNPKIDLLVNLGELHELPALLHDAGALAAKLIHRQGLAGKSAKQVAAVNLAANFGVGPIVQDLITALDFVKAVSDREKLIREMSQAKPKRFRRRIGKETWVRTSTEIPWHAAYDTDSNTNKFIITVAGTRQYWYTARARILDVPLERDLHDLAIRSVLGSGLEIATIWNLIPWTWLIDWFTTTGAIVGALRNTIRWQYEGLNLMYQDDYKVTGEFPNLGFTNVNIKNPEGSATVKWRGTASLTTLPQLRTPFLTGRQWGILGSLLTVRL
jgi:hypothetical protein